METKRASVPRELRTGLRNYWYPVLTADQLPADAPVGVTRLGEELVAWRDADGVAHVFADRCAHRGVRLSIGDIVDGRLQCRYHGLQYDGTGQCRLVPIEQRDDGHHAQRLCVTSYPTEERAGLVWTYLGTSTNVPPLEMQPEMSDPDYVWIVWETTWNANWLLIHDNTCDPYHVPFLHGHFVTRVGPDGLEVEKLPDGNPIVTVEAFGVLVTEELEATATDTTVLVRRKTATDDHNQSFDEVQFTLPCLASVWVPVPDGGSAVRLHQYELPIDEHRTVVYSWAGRVAPEGDREAMRSVLDEFFRPVTTQVFDDDSWITENQPDVEVAWTEEHLLPFDAGPPRVRKVIRDAFERQLCDSTAPTSLGDGAR